jgi:3-oxoacyl-[acyl-carrier protein] reductase
MSHDSTSMRAALVTGCSTGIGKAIAERLRQGGYHVVGAQRRGPGIQVDLEDHRVIPGAWRSVLDALTRPPQLVVLNAGRSMVGRLIDLEVDDFLSLMTLNLLSPLLLAREVLRTWVDHGLPGHLVFIGSQAALAGAKPAGEVAYAASKGGIHGVIGALASEYGPQVRVNGVAPGHVATEAELALLAESARSAGRSLDDLERDVAASTPVGRWIRAEEVAEAVMFLEACAAMSGAIINVSGGSSAH